MELKPVSRAQLALFFQVAPRGLGRVLDDLGLRLIGGCVQWGLVWQALGLASQQSPEHWVELTEPLWTAADVARYCGVSTSIIYRWNVGRHPARMVPMPAAIDISAGRADARALRWRKAEIVAWQNGRSQPEYAQRRPAFGTLLPLPQGGRRA